MGSRARSPSADPAPRCGAQASGPGPAKRPRLQEAPQVELLKLPSLQDVAPRISVMLLAENSALTVLLDDTELVLEPHPTSALRVCLPGQTLILVPEALVLWAERQVGGHQGLPPAALEPCAFLSASGEVVAIQVGAFRADFGEEPPAAPPNPAHQQPQALLPGMGPAAGPVFRPHPEVPSGSSPDPPGPTLQPWLWAPTPSPPRSSQGPYFSLRSHLLQSCLSSALQPLPVSPSPGVREHPKVSRGRRRCRARRRLFQE
ncbi:proline-rich protein 23A-like [Sorex fumeus]|uniref:proline-rich protein 23A-like n=1 Tax=Sorex fumeus TaxID=62283 RepID=UPI0024AE3696|nr:proline-rich protein 23A-like [Sorex fumeus]